MSFKAKPTTTDGRSLGSSEDDDDDDNWQVVVSKRKMPGTPLGNSPKRKQFEDNQPSTSNRFSVLTSSETDNTKGTETQTIPKPPPIFIPNVNNVSKMMDNLSKVIPVEHFNFKALLRGEVRLMIKNVESFRKIIKYFEEHNISYHTYQIKTERAFRIVIKGLHHSTDISDVKAFLMSKGHEVRSVRNIISRITKLPLPMFFVDLDPKHNNKDIYDIRSIYNNNITIEPPKRFNDLVRCLRCQDFGHTKSYCRKPYKCGKCGLGHPTSECKKPADTPPRCVHCLNMHTSSYKGCPVYQKLIQKKSNLTHKRNFGFTENNVNTVQNPDTGMSYAQMVRGEDSTEVSVLSKIEAMMAKQIELTNSLINMMSLLMTKLCK